MGRKIKLTESDSDRADQRARTAKLKAKTAGMESLGKTPPRYLKGYASSAWMRLVPLLNEGGLVKQIDKPLVESLCQQIQLQRLAYEDIQANGLTTNDGKYKNPSAQIIDSSTAKISQLSDKLGLSPAARASIMVEHDAVPDQGDLMTKLKQAGGDAF